MRAAALIPAVLCAASLTAGPTITIDLDFEAARAILMLPATDPSPARLEEIAALPGTQALIRQAARFSPESTEANFIAGLSEFAAGRNPSPTRSTLRAFGSASPKPGHSSPESRAIPPR
jgi:hypothetical protein